MRGKKKNKIKDPPPWLASLLEQEPAGSQAEGTPSVDAQGTTWADAAAVSVVGPWAALSGRRAASLRPRPARRLHFPGSTGSVLLPEGVPPPAPAPSDPLLPQVPPGGLLRPNLLPWRRLARVTKATRLCHPPGAVRGLSAAPPESLRTSLGLRPVLLGAGGRSLPLGPPLFPLQAFPPPRLTAKCWSSSGRWAAPLFSFTSCQRRTFQTCTIESIVQ